MQIEFQLERRIGALSENPSGYTKELNWLSGMRNTQNMTCAPGTPTASPAKALR